MKRLLQEVCKEVSQSTEKRLCDKAFASLQKRYWNILTRAEKELPVSLSKPYGKRGKLAKSDAHNLWERLRIHEAAVLPFAKDPHVSFTNNRAERDLRMSKAKQKVSGCFRVSEYAHAYCRISSYLQSMANKGYKRPFITLLDNGNIRILWKNQEGEQIGLQFLGGKQVQYVLFALRENGIMARASGRDTINGVNKWCQ